jgi:hypothetical protein
VLEVVEHEQQPLRVQVAFQGPARRPSLRLPQAQDPGDGRDDEPGVPEQGQPDERRPVREPPVRLLRAHTPRGLHGEAGLADAAYPREREQPGVGLRYEAPYPVELALAPEEWGGGAGQRGDGEGLRGAPRGDVAARGDRLVASGHGGEQRVPVALAQIQGVCEGPDGVRVGALPHTALQGAYGVRGEARPRGQLLLGQPGRRPQFPQEAAEGRSPRADLSAAARSVTSRRIPRGRDAVPEGSGGPVAVFPAHTLPPQGTVCGCCGCSAAVRGGTVVAGKRGSKGR